MSKVLLLIAETVIVINVIYVLLPNGTFEKYSKHVFGLILMLLFIGTITKVDISSEILRFDEDVPVYNYKEVEEVLENQTQNVIRDKIKEMLENQNILAEDVEVFVEDNIISRIEIDSGKYADADKIVTIVAEYCGVDKEIVVVK